MAKTRNFVKKQFNLTSEVFFYFFFSKKYFQLTTHSMEEVLLAERVITFADTEKKKSGTHFFPHW